jgi:hypothetical protein
VANHHCPARELHLRLGLEFVLPHSIPDGPQMQSTWRFCARCHGMFFADSDTQHHHCAGFQGVHDAAGLVFALPHDLPETATVQTKWRFCVNCHGMFFDGPE